MRQLQISHVTEYRFPSPVTLLPHRLLLRPREDHNVHIESSVLAISPKHSVQWKRDVLDNSVAVVKLTELSDVLRIASTVVIRHYDENPFDFLLDDHAVTHPFAYTEAERIELTPFLQATYPSDQAAIRQWLQNLQLPAPMQTFALLDLLNREISNSFSYQMREAPGVQSPAFTLTHRSGSCRDFAALLMETCRHLGLAVRFVSGYLFTWSTDSDNASTHAWIEAYLPGAGWKGFDPTIGEITGDRHIAVAVARHPEAVPPVAGDYIGTPDQRPSLNVMVNVSTPKS